MAEQKTIRTMVEDIQSEVAKGNLTLPRANELLTKLAALKGNINEEITQRDYEYSKKLLECLDNEKKANRARIKAETSIEYLAKKRAHNLKELADDLIGSLKYLIRSLEDEYKQGNLQ